MLLLALGLFAASWALAEIAYRLSLVRISRTNKHNPFMCVTQRAFTPFELLACRAATLEMPKIEISEGAFSYTGLIWKIMPWWGGLLGGIADIGLLFSVVLGFAHAFSVVVGLCLMLTIYFAIGGVVFVGRATLKGNIGVIGTHAGLLLSFIAWPIFLWAEIYDRPGDA